MGGEEEVKGEMPGEWERKDTDDITKIEVEKKQGNMVSKMKERVPSRSRKENKEKSDINNKATKEQNQDDKGKKENFFQRILNMLSMRLKRKKMKSVDTKAFIIDNDDKKEKKVEDETQNLSILSSTEDLEIIALCKDLEEDKEQIIVSNLASSSSKPPLPCSRRPPASASSTLSRPVTQLDSALKQFRLSTAASRENLRNSRVDISQVEQQVKTMVTSRPSTPSTGGRRSRAPPENVYLTEQWAKLSASLTDLRKKEI